MANSACTLYSGICQIKAKNKLGILTCVKHTLDDKAIFASYISVTISAGKLTNVLKDTIDT